MPPVSRPPIKYTNVSKERDLYTKLVFDLGRSPAESMQVVAFLMWLQTLNPADKPIDFLVGEMMKEPSEIINGIAGEILECLKSVQSEIMPFTEGVYEISLLREFLAECTKLNITLVRLYNNRENVIKGVRKMVKAFNGIYEDDDEEDSSSTTTATATATATATVTSTTTVSPRPPPATPGGSKFCGDGDGGDHGTPKTLKSDASKGQSVEKSADVEVSSIPSPDPNKRKSVEKSKGVEGSSVPSPDAGKGKSVEKSNGVEGSSISSPDAGKGKSVSAGAEGSSILSSDAGNKGKSVEKSNGVEGGSAPAKSGSTSAGLYVPPHRYHRDNPDDRTVFLTFSNGYPIAAADVAEYFNRIFSGDVIETIYMQNVAPNQQVMYARMVCTRAAIVDAITDHGGQAIVKYIIKGRHVWARKYVKRAWSG